MVFGGRRWPGAEGIAREWSATDTRTDRWACVGALAVPLLQIVFSTLVLDALLGQRPGPTRHLRQRHVAVRVLVELELHEHEHVGAGEAGDHRLPLQVPAGGLSSPDVHDDRPRSGGGESL